MDSPKQIAAVAVYCGSSAAVPQAYLEVAEQVGARIAGNGWSLVYGGGAIGMMGRCADGALAAGGQVIGVITHWLADYEIQHHGISELHVVETMHDRKRLMTERADAFLILPGGYGTADEMFEAITWRQLQLHNKPIVLLDHDHFFRPLLDFLTQASELRFIRPEHLRLIEAAPSVDEAFALLENHRPVAFNPDKWWVRE